MLIVKFIGSNKTFEASVSRKRDYVDVIGDIQPGSDGFAVYSERGSIIADYSGYKSAEKIDGGYRFRRTEGATEPKAPAEEMIAVPDQLSATVANVRVIAKEYTDCLANYIGDMSTDELRRVRFGMLIPVKYRSEALQRFYEEGLVK